MEVLEHLHKVVLMILKDLDYVCKKNNITYYLAFGSALGAIRHRGFIPWDDDVDIILDNNNYKKLISICRQQLDSEKYYIEEGNVDSPSAYSKIRLRGTIYPEDNNFSNCIEHGIFIDIFRMDNFSSNKLVSIWQYICSKYYLCYLLDQRGYKSSSILKKCLLFSSFPLKNKKFRSFILYQIERLNKYPPINYACCYTKYGYKQSVIPSEYYGLPIIVRFEDAFFPVPKKIEEYLKRVYGNFLQLPPLKKRVCPHLDKDQINFGKY